MGRWFANGRFFNMFAAPKPPRCPWCMGDAHEREIDRFRCQVRYQAEKRDGTPIYQPGGRKA